MYYYVMCTEIFNFISTLHVFEIETYRVSIMTICSRIGEVTNSTPFDF